MSHPDFGDAEFTPGYITPERTHEEPSRALFAAWQNSYIDQRDARADRDFQRGLLDDIVHNAYAGERDELHREAVQQGGEVLAYFWFGNDATPLPRALRRFLIMDDDTPVLTLNPHEIAGSQFDIVLEKLHIAGLSRLAEYRQNLYKEQSPYVFEPLARALVANTPGYRLLESFNVTQHSWRERPLTYTERLLEERMAEESIRRRHGLSERQALFTHPGAQRELTRAVQRLDETTRYDRFETPETKPPLQRAYDFFSQIIIDDSAITGKELHKVEIVHWDYEGAPQKSLRVVTDQMDIHTDSESVVNYAETQGFLNTPSTTRANYMSTNLVADMVSYLFDEAEPDRDYSQLLNEFLDRYTSALVADLGKFTSSDQALQQFGPLATLLTLPMEADEVLDSFFIFTDVLPKLNNPNVIHSRQEYRAASRNTLGEIRKRPRYEADMRIMQYKTLDAELAALNEDEADMVLHLPKLSPKLMPHIPGYEVVSHDAEKQLFGLVYTPEADPYTECTTLIPDEARQQLATQYAGLGLNELAVLVQSTSELTVTQLAHFIVATNRYALPGKRVASKIPAELSDYAAQVKDGRLSMQCVGSAHFMRLSLQEVFGAQAASIISGDTIPKSGSRLSTAGHGQTAFVDPNSERMYIVDATSGGLNLALWREILSETAGVMRRKLGLGALKAAKQQTEERTAPQAPRERPLPHVPETMSEEAAEELRRALLAQTKEALILQLRMIYGHDGQPMPQDTLFEIVTKLPNDDIVFRSLSAAMLAPQGRIAKADIEQLLQYVSALQACDDPALLRRVDPYEYTNQPRLLAAIQSHVGQLARLVR